MERAKNGDPPPFTMLSTIGRTEPTLEKFYTEDICCLRSDPSHIGVIERTTGDVDSHAPRPQAEYGDLACHSDISKAAFRRFKHDGIPPAGTVLVLWQTQKATLLIPTRHLSLIDRSLMVGDVVKKHPEDPMSGVITQTDVTCVVCASGFKDPNYAYNLLVAGGEDAPLPGLEIPIPVQVSAHDLKCANHYKEGDLVIYKGWVGQIDDIFDDICLRLSNGSIVAVDLASEVEKLTEHQDSRFEVGSMATTSKANLRRGRWIVGRYDAALLPIGDVVSVTPTHFNARWLWMYSMIRPSFDRSQEPPVTLTVKSFENGGGRIYDVSRSPQTANGFGSSHLPFMSGDKFRFKDLAGAAMKYRDINRIPLSETHGFDLNVFTIVITKTRGKVLWQDLTEEIVTGTDVVPDYNIEDNNDLSPGEIVITNESVPVPGEPWIFQPKRVGVVQTVSPTDRIASVKWLPKAQVQYNQIGLDQNLEEHSLLEGSTLRLDETTEEECLIEDATLYDIRTVGALGRRRGDYVVLHPSKAAPRTDPMSDIDWFGEVIALNLDGTLTVRLGAANTVKDVKVSPEYTTIAHSSDALSSVGDDGYEDYGADEDNLGSGDSYDDLVDGEDLGSDDGIWTVDGEPVAEDDDEEWSTEGADSDNSSAVDDDEDMPNAEADEVPDTKATQQDEVEATYVPVQSDIPNNLNPTLKEPSVRTHGTGNAPPAFDVLQSEPPATHEYIYPDPPPLVGPLLKRIRKEHTILSSSLPEGIFVRTWESRLDLLSVLIVGPLGTPYEYAPFLIDMRIPPDYPQAPPDAFFHSWTSGQGSGPVNPNLYENGKICLSLLGTWHADEKGENWSARSTILQVLVSILGLVLVREPYFNEAGFEARAGSEDAKIPSQLYSERTYFRTRAFITHAIRYGVPAFGDLVKWLYTSENEDAPKLLDKAIEAGTELMQAGDGAVDIRAGLSRMSRGALMMLDREVKTLKELKAGLVNDSNETDATRKSNDSTTAS